MSKKNIVQQSEKMVAYNSKVQTVNINSDPHNKRNKRRFKLTKNMRYEIRNNYYFLDASGYRHTGYTTYNWTPSHRPGKAKTRGIATYI